MIRKKIAKILEEINELHPHKPATIKKEPDSFIIKLGYDDFFGKAAEEIEGIIIEATGIKTEEELDKRKKEYLVKVKQMKKRDPKKYKEIKKVQSATKKVASGESKLAEPYKLDANERKVQKSFVSFARSLKTNKTEEEK